MAEITKYVPGTFCWTDLATPDAAAAKRFYPALIGWKIQDLPTSQDEVYSMALVHGQPACALYQAPEDKLKLGLPPRWLTYVSVENAEATVKKAQAAGGKVIEPAFDVMDVGRMAILQDPTGAVFAVWQPKRHIGARVYDLPGTVCWRELMTPNSDVAGKFYSKVFGWTLSSEKFGVMTYTILKNGEEGVGGMMALPTKDTAPEWLTYFVVENCDQVVAKAKTLGGSVCKPATDIPGVGRFAVLADAQGAPFGIMESKE